MYQDSLAEKGSPSRMSAIIRCNCMPFQMSHAFESCRTKLLPCQEKAIIGGRRNFFKRNITFFMILFATVQEQCLLRGILYCLESWQPEKHPFKGSFVFFKECLICEFTTALLDRNPVRRKHTLHFVHGNFLFQDDICAVEGKPDMLKPSLYFFNRKSLEESRVLLLQKIHFSN